MSDKIVSISGSVLPESQPPSERLIAFLEDQLERARSGEIAGFAGAVLNKDRGATYFLAGYTGGFSMLGALDCASLQLRRIAMGEE